MIYKHFVTWNMASNTKKRGKLKCTLQELDEKTENHGK